MAQRWEGILHARFASSCTQPATLMASLCFSPATGSLLAPAGNAILFMGDRVAGTGNPTIERLSRLENVAAILVSKLETSVNAWVVEAPKFNGPFACYEGFLPSMTQTGEPLSYDPQGLPAANAISSLLNNCLEKVNTELLHTGKKGHFHLQSVAHESNGLHVEDLQPVGSTTTVQHHPKTLIFGFSKGGVVLNQLLAEIADAERCRGNRVDIGGWSKGRMENKTPQDIDKVQSKVDQSWFGLPGKLLRKLGNQTDCHERYVMHNEQQRSSDSTCVLPAAAGEFLESISEIHYVDVGLNTCGAYQTNPQVLENVVKAASSRSSGLHLAFHGTPRQWSDLKRHWISSEKDCCIALLKDGICRSGNEKVRVTEKLYFGEEEPSLQMHFEILQSLVLA